MKTLPLSILLPIYNHGHLLPLALESALSQSFGDFEVIIIDDGSTDHTLEIIHRYLKQDHRLKLVRHEKNQGIAQAVKSGLQVAEGKYLHGLSATDCYCPEFLQQSMTLLFRYPQIGLCFTDAGFFTDDPKHYIPYQCIENALEVYIFPSAKIQKVFKYAHLSIPGLTTILKKSAFLKYGGYRRELHFLCDGFLNQQIALTEGAIYIPQVFSLFRQPEYSKISSQTPHIRREALNNLQTLLLQPENRELLHQMRKAATLGILCKEQPWKCLQHPVLWPLYIDLVERYLYKRLRHLLKKPLVNIEFLRAHSL